MRLAGGVEAHLAVNSFFSPGMASKMERLINICSNSLLL